MSAISISVRDRLRSAREKKQEEYKAKEADKRGVLRAGMTGIMSETGDIAGKCHRLSHLRTLGIQDTPDEQKQMMFELGFASEDITSDLLALTLEPGEVILREEEIPISWQTSNGTLVTGRPDIVICDWTVQPGPGIVMQPLPMKQGDTGWCKPKLALELKSVHSMWTARNVLFGARDAKTGDTTPPSPQMDNICQAAHYMWRLGVPYKLVYKAYSQLGQSAGEWASKVINIPARGEANSQYIDYDNYGKFKGMKQFEIVYDLRIDSKGRVEWKREEQDDNSWTRTIVTTQDIQRYYEYCSTMAEKKELGPRPMTIDSSGEKLGYKSCSYCIYQKTCDRTEKLGYDQWLAAIREVK